MRRRLVARSSSTRLRGGDKVYLQGTFTPQPVPGGQPYALYVVDGSSAYTSDPTGIVILDLSGGGAPRVVSRTLPLASYYKRGVSWFPIYWPFAMTPGYLLLSETPIIYDVQDPMRATFVSDLGWGNVARVVPSPDRRHLLAPRGNAGVGVIALPTR
jgi:hypothetical protein